MTPESDDEDGRRRVKTDIVLGQGRRHPKIPGGTKTKNILLSNFVLRVVLKNVMWEFDLFII